MDELYLTDCDSAWKHEYVTYLLGLSNEYLLSEVYDKMEPDYWDGQHSTVALWKLHKAKVLLARKLTEIGFL